jgi:2-polyprenyl-3-methyl-5-hydroxy-6-metoxy-1,4-benzoquinol methylase
MTSTEHGLLDRFDACILCGSKNLNPLRGYEKNFLTRCHQCKFVFCNRKPSTQELTAHYNLYPRENFISEITLRRYEALLDKFEKYRKTNNLIDVGCGDGLFLVSAKKRNWNVYGTEFTEEALEVCKKKGIEMTKSPLDSKHYSSGFFDVITSFEVIEHINTPREELRSFFEILRKGGIVYVTTPNFNSISRNIVGSKWNIIEYPEHLTYYTRSTLRKVFNAFNFSLLEINTTGVSLSRIKISKGKMQNLEKARSTDEVLRRKAEENVVFRAIKTAVNYALNKLGKGDTIKAFFQKK